ncbi:MAG: EAL domain-containing protein [Pacificimonas sp.]
MNSRADRRKRPHRHDGARLVAAAKLRAFDRGVRAAAIGNLVNLALIVFISISYVPGPVLAVSIALIAAGIVGRAWNSARYRHDLRTVGVAKVRLGSHVQSATWTAGIMGGAWGLGIILLSQHVAVETAILLCMIGCGMMAASALNMGNIPSATYAYSTAIGIGGIIVLARTGGMIGATGIILVVSFMALLIQSVRQGSRNFVAMTLRAGALQRTRDTVRLLLKDFEDQGSDWLWELDSNGHVRNPSRRFAEAALRPLEMLPERRFVMLFEAGPERDRLAEHIESGRSFSDLTLSLLVSGEQRWWSLSGRNVPTDGRSDKLCFRGVATDITDARKAESRVAYMAHYDSLTDLANRFLFRETINRRITDCGDRGDIAVLYLDLDHFKAVNDTLGHSTGDRVLQCAARRIQRCCDGSDLVARLGGDEFAILVQGGVEDGELIRRATCITAALARPMDLGDHQVVSGTSIGIARFGRDGDDVETLMRAADLALYAAKSRGRGCHIFYQAGMDEMAQQRRQVEMDLRAALELGQLHLAFQPLVDIRTGNTVSYEALMRWDHPERGMIPPDTFIPIAEETGMIVQLGEWVLREAISELKSWPEDIGVSVNLSPVQMKSSSLISTIISSLAATGVDACRLELEITEGVLMEGGETNIAILRKIHDLGVKIALDDFGTGYSSLSYLRSFPFDKIKIDKCFVEELAEREDCRAIVRAVTELAGSLGMVTTAEGVETASQLEQLSAEGCDQVQGFLFSQALPANMLTDLRRRGAPVIAPAPENVARIAALDKRGQSPARTDRRIARGRN